MFTNVDNVITYYLLRFITLISAFVVIWFDLVAAAKGLTI
jgi:hypothetical protein